MDDLKIILRDDVEDKGEEEVMKWARNDSASVALATASRRSFLNLLRFRLEKLKSFLALGNRWAKNKIAYTS